jgi:hypothetical protein
VNLLRRVAKRNLTRFYADQLFANEIMLMAYYIAALNIEHAYFEITRTYDSFEGLCFVDTLDIADRKQKGFSFINEENKKRVELQKRIGDGALNYGRENIIETYYTAHVWRGIYVASGLQHILNPGYNRDRGPVLVPSFRLHFEF